MRIPYSTFGITPDLQGRLHKRDAGGWDNDKKPKKFYYHQMWCPQIDRELYEAIDRCTSGRFVWHKVGQTVGFEYESDLTMFLMSYQERKFTKVFGH